MTKGAFNEVGEISREAWDALIGSEPTYSYCDRVKKLEQQLQEQNQEIAELKENQEKYAETINFIIEIQGQLAKVQNLQVEESIEFVKEYLDAKDCVRDRIMELQDAVRDLQDFKSKFMDFKSQFNCSRFNSHWPWR